MELPELEPKSLAIFLLGPGVGELVAIRIPDAGWIMIDGCGPEEGSDGVALLQRYDGQARVIVMTHPHHDHCRGFSDLVESATRGPPTSWPRIGFALPPQPRETVRLRDPPRDLLAAKAEQAIATITSRWDRHPACRWNLDLHDEVEVGAATLHVVGPGPTARASPPKGRADWNRLSTAMRLRWHEVDVVLGGDLVEKPGNGWTETLDAYPDLARHVVLKIPHHGSIEALHRGLLQRPDGAPTPTWIATPYSSQRLPRFDDGEKGGMRELHRHADRVHLTAWPRPAVYDLDPPTQATRSQARSLVESAGGESKRPTPRALPDRWVGLEIGDDGEVRIHQAREGVLVTRGPEDARPAARASKPVGKVAAAPRKQRKKKSTRG